MLAIIPKGKIFKVAKKGAATGPLNKATRMISDISFLRGIGRLVTIQLGNEALNIFY